MNWDFTFIITSVLLGVGLAMDAFSVSLVNGLNDPQMKKGRMNAIAGVFAGFQFAMPMIGWICVHTLAQRFKAFEKAIPWIALILLAFIGGKMLIEGIRDRNVEEKASSFSIGELLMQGIATSIDALSVGFTIAEYGWVMALTASIIIAAVTFVICIAGLAIGKEFGAKLSNKAQILGGIILIAIGIEIFLKDMF